ncbi:proteasome lid subunit RPN8/RPN11 [Salibacterium salarium]|uniref:M67 family metallopeptidase n=1 Tax=Salibacterium salarium TaxID=284579 RepID=UPI00278B98FC|nr:M67 family metallopeptidase [Salibacterium salarium]MDQ0300695.1 proteasome lid subunit RPN8/RPN11 [Salibacterium salarium]
MQKKAKAAVAAKKPSLAKSVMIKRAVWEEMIYHCKHEFPLEACGILSGYDRRCDVLWPMRNMKRSKDSFEVSQAETDRTFRFIKEKQQRLTGIYHSHPTTDPYPSLHDIENHHYPEAAYFIISLARLKPKIKCYRIEGKRVVSIKIIVI